MPHNTVGCKLVFEGSSDRRRRPQFALTHRAQQVRANDEIDRVGRDLWHRFRRVVDEQNRERDPFFGGGLAQEQLHCNTSSKASRAEMLSHSKQEKKTGGSERER
jgi:hypothetical protein